MRRRHLRAVQGGSSRDRRRARRAAERATANAATTSTFEFVLTEGVSPVINSDGHGRSSFVGFQAPDETVASDMLGRLTAPGWAAWQIGDSWIVGPLDPIQQNGGAVGAVAVSLLTTLDLEAPSDEDLLAAGRELVALAAEARDADALADIEEALAPPEELELDEPLGTALAADAVEAPVVEPPSSTSPFVKRWTATFAPEGAPTDDGRLFAPGSIRWRELPLTLMAMTETQEGHTGAKVAGKIEGIAREGNLIVASGYFDDSEFGQEIARMVGDGILRGLSVDLAIPQYVTLPRSKVLDEEGAYIGPLPDEDRPDPEDAPTLLDILFGDEGDDIMFVVLDGVIGMATVCPFPAFAEANIELASSALVAGAISLPDGAVWNGPAGFTTYATDTTNEGGSGESDDPGSRSPAAEPPPAVTAAAAGLAPVAPPADWFSTPEPDGPCPLTVTDDGHVYGHAAVWGTCHIGIEGVCVEPPASATDYAYFHLKECASVEGDRVPVGTITLDTGHADRRLARAAATAHYDDTGTAVADVVAIDGEHGIWVTGALRPDADENTVRKLSGAVLSGDWRDFNGHLELVALLAVNVPGFPVPRTSAAVLASADGPQVVSLLAAGINDGSHRDRLALERVRAYALADEFAQMAEDVK